MKNCPGCANTPLSRREALKFASNGFGLMALSALMADKAYAGPAAAVTASHPVAKVKNVIFCFMPGGVSHVDTFDPKPKLTELDGKSFDGFYQVGAKSIDDLPVGGNGRVEIDANGEQAFHRNPVYCTHTLYTSSRVCQPSSARKRGARP